MTIPENRLELANVLTVALGLMRRRVVSSDDEIAKLPVKVSKTIDLGNLNVELKAGPSVLLNVPVPAKVVVNPTEVMRRILLLS